MHSQPAILEQLQAHQPSSLQREVVDASHEHEHKEQPIAAPLQEEDEAPIESGCCDRLTRWMQETSYQCLAVTFWDTIMSGFRPGRVRAMELFEFEPADRILFVGEGSGLDLDCLPEVVNKNNVWAFDFSPQMVRQCKAKARQQGIPEANVFQGDAQHLPYRDERFNKIFFPLSLGSIPNPHLALLEAERVLAPDGKIVVFEKLVDDGAEISASRRCLNYLTKCTFADINRNLSDMQHDLPLKIVHYESLANRLGGCFAKRIGAYYRLAVIVRNNEYVDRPAIQARL